MIQPQVANLIQKQRAVPSQFPLAHFPGLQSACKCSRYIAEQLRLKQFARNGGAVHLHERLALPPQVMDRPRRHAFSRAGLPQDQDRLVNLRRPQDQLPHQVVIRRIAPERSAQLRLPRQRLQQLRKRLLRGNGLQGLVLSLGLPPDIPKNLIVHPNNIDAALPGLLRILE